MLLGQRIERDHLRCSGKVQTCLTVVWKVLGSICGKSSLQIDSVYLLKYMSIRINY